ncbi:MAG: Ig-like domain-containing protein, partial [Cyclobacteriaceae bacterium]
GNVFDVDVAPNGDVYIMPQSSPQQIYKSVDKGVTWLPLSSTGLNGFTREIKVLSNGSILGFGNDGLGRIYKSIDDGATFTEQFASAFSTFYYGSSGGARNPVVSPNGTIAVFGSVAEGLVVSTDFGTTWTIKNTSTILDPSNGFVGSFMYDKDGNLLMHAILDVTVTPWVAEIVKSSDNGSTWTVLPTPSPINEASGNFYSKRIATLGTGEYLLTIRGFYDCYRSTDGGATWNLVGNLGEEFVNSVTVGTTSYLQGLGVAGILKTNDGGLTYETFSTGMTHPQATEISLLNNKDMLIGASRPYYSDDFGQTFALSTFSPANKYLQVADSLIGYGSRFLLSSNDGGKAWTQFGDERFLSFLTSDATGLGFYGANGNTISYTTDFVVWQDIVLTGMPDDFFIADMVIDEGGVIYAIVYDNSTDTNKVFKIVFGSGTNISAAIGTTEPTTTRYVNGKIYLYDSRGIIYKSANGETWSQVSAPAGIELITTEGYLFITSFQSGLWLSRNDGAAWQNVGDVPSSSGSSPIFQDIVINEFDGFAYATLTNSVAKKSGNIILTDDEVVPIVSSLSPMNDATNVIARPQLTITFNEVTTKLSGKKIRIFDQAQPAIPVHVIDAGEATQNLKSFSITPPSDLSYLKTYFVVMDAGAFVDIFGNEFGGISAQTTWRFTIQEQPDTQVPTITLVTTDLNLVKTTARPFEITVTDNKNLPTDKSKIWYRGISKLSTAAFTSANMTVASGSGTKTSGFTIEVADQWYDEMGLEFYFESTDASGNVGRSPATPDTYHYSYISYPSAANPVITSGRISFGGQANNYRVITVPFDLQDPQVLAILNELGGVDKTKWRMFSYAGNEQFTENPTSFTRGKVYWLNVRNSPGSIQIEGASTPQNNRMNFFSIELNPGWNQIGNPYPVDISWEQVRAAHTATVGAVKIYDGTTYADGDILSPYQGGFVFVTEPGSLTLKVRFKDIITGGRKNEQINVNLSEPNWLLPISITTNEIVNAMGGVGMNENAKLDWDEFDDLNPPRFLDYAELTFDREKIFNYPFAQDVVPSQNEFIWDFKTVSSGGVTTLNWDNSLISGTEDLILFDIKRQIVVDMKTENSYSFDAESKGFKIFFGTNMREKLKPTEATLSAPFPNPMRGFSSVKYTLPQGKEPYLVSLEVYNSLGQRVATLMNGEVESGFYTADWDAENNPTGIYFYRLTILEKGVSSILTEKVILNR